MQRCRAQSGVTAIELMMVVAIVGILIAVAAPNLRTFFINNRLTTASSEFMAALSLARNESIRRGVQVSIRRLSPTTREWTQGWEIFVDPNGNGTRDVGEELVRQAPALASSLTLRSSDIVATFVPFTPDGRVALALDDGDNALLARAVFFLCYDSVAVEGTQSRSRAILLNSPGRARLAVDTNNNGYVENVRGNDITNCTNP